jgi:Dullard-like phosphatase family protein
MFSLNELFETEDQLSPKKSQVDLMKRKRFQKFENIEIDFIESSQNFQGNYSNYVSKALKSMVNLKKLNYSEILEEKMLCLGEPQCQSKKTLILDLDETLIHADFDFLYHSHDQIISFMYEECEITVPIFIRPGLMEFIQKISEIFEIVIFTASRKEYADAVLNFLDPDGRYFRNRLYRDHCIPVNNKIYIKDLRILSNRSLENIVILDNSLYSFTNQISNGILINSFYNDKEDKELFNVLNYLQSYLVSTKDVRLINEKVFNFGSIIEEFMAISNCKKKVHEL